MVRRSPAGRPECDRRAEQCLPRCSHRLPPEFVQRSREPNLPEKIQKEARTDALGRTLPAPRFWIPECRRKQKGLRHQVSILPLFLLIAYSESARLGRLRAGATQR